MVDFYWFHKMKNNILNFDVGELRDSIHTGVTDIEKYLNENKLNDIIEKNKDLTKARFHKSNENRSAYDFKLAKNYKIKNLINKTFNNEYDYSGIFWYPVNGFCGWHTNSDAPGERIYVVWNEEDNKSFLRYKDIETGEIVTKWEKRGWQVNRFTIGSADKPFWHCIGTYTNRLSFGFREVLD